VLAGGGNTSVKIRQVNVFGEEEDVLYVKGSGGQLSNIETEGFAAVRLEVLRKIIRLDHLPDVELVRLQRSALIDPAGPDPSLEAILHAIMPFTYVDHTHADAVLCITNTVGGDALARRLYGSHVLVVPYVKPGFALAKAVSQLVQGVSLDRLDGLIVLNHGVFSFGQTAQESYERMVRLVNVAEDYLHQHSVIEKTIDDDAMIDLLFLARLRREIATTRGEAVIAGVDSGPEARGFASIPQAGDLARRGPLTPDHTIHVKPFPAVIRDDPAASVSRFVSEYEAYFQRHAHPGLMKLDPAPRWAIWPDCGLLAFGRSAAEVRTIIDIARHTARAIQWAEALGGWQPVSEGHNFELEYWDLQQAKLKRSRARPEFQGRIVLVTGAASGIGLACAREFCNRGAAVAGLDINPGIVDKLDELGQTGIVCDVTDAAALKAAVERTARTFGGLDILIPNAGIFPQSLRIEEMDDAVWSRSMEINLNSQQRLLQYAIPYLKHGWDPSVVFIASKNVPAPGPGASAYSVAKAGVTQLARVAALELAGFGVRVNMVHPDAVFDTGIWTPEVIEKRARHYGLTVDQYKTKNLLHTELTSKNVAELVCAIAGTAFAKTTGAQIPIDGGNERVI
jgi:rhamnose utilization protein RhaD (predicted bifunctional aldolase and dehydrogenase)/NAD(P)-dependent dehydrogenase (short-subunit alcohol dehydrogenase family)